ncbi:hypothetical protein QBC44DRAFT_331669 [Cladorrhinum sp. PSN332]|nr:hypothetical protein QBC44DRAFT_331669 [Cladorrhinum sp. PSN332]
MSSQITEPDLTLPPTVPLLDKLTGDLLPAALYTLVDMTPEALLELQTMCESEYADCGYEFTPGSNVTPAPRSHFVGEPLRAVIDYHVQMNQEHADDLKLDAIWFIVAFHQDWNKHGVLLVTLDAGYCGDEEARGKPDAIKMKAVHSGIIIAGLQVANTGWEETKQNYEIGTPCQEIQQSV